MTLAETFEQAAQVCETKGMCAGVRHDDEGKVCALGALEDVWGFEPPATSRALVRLLGLTPQKDAYNGDCSSEPSYVVAAWSNNLVDAGRADEVIAGFRRAAELARQEEM